MGRKTQNIAFGAAIAAVAGYVAGLLTAPKSGSETRADIQHATMKARTEAERTLKRAYAELHTGLEAVRKRVPGLQAHLEEEVQTAIRHADVAKGKARDVLSAFRDGLADDTDLHMAVDEVQAAIQHLQSFLSKDVETKKS